MRAALASIPQPVELRTLEQAMETFGQTVKQVKKLGDELDRLLAKLEDASGQLAAEGVTAHAEFGGPLDAAYRAWRERQGIDVPLRVPTFLR